MYELKILIAGLGSIGRRHLRNLKTLGQGEIILFRTHQSTLPEDELEAFPVETDLETALSRKPDAVVIANPTALHMDVAISAAQAGCHLLIEKPIAPQWDEKVAELRSIVSANDIRTLVGFQFRFHPVLSRIQELMKGTIGHMLSFRVHWGEYLPGWHPWEDYRQSYAARKDLGGGVVNTLCHTLDYVRWLFGEVEWQMAVSALSIWIISSVPLHTGCELIAKRGLCTGITPPVLQAFIMLMVMNGKRSSRLKALNATHCSLMRCGISWHW